MEKVSKIIIGGSVLFLSLIAIYYTYYVRVNADLITGDIERSSFLLAEDSIFPKWFDLPKGYSRNNLTVVIYYYAPSDGKPNLKAELISKNGEMSIDDILILKKGDVLETKYGYKKNLTGPIPPSFSEDTIDGISHIIEHKDPVFYISDKK